MLKRYKIGALIITLLCIIPLVSNTCQAEINLAVGPAYILMDNGLRNSTYQNTIYIFNYNNFDSVVFFNMPGEIGNWTKFYEYENSTTPINNTYVNKMSDKPIKIIIKIPPTAANGDYLGNILFTVAPIENKSQEGNVSTVHLSTPVTVMINVSGNQIVSAEVEKIEIKNVELNYPADIDVNIINTGNVRIRPKINVTITNKEGIILDRLTKFTSYIEMGEIYKETMKWDTSGKIAGIYNALFQIFIDNKIIEEENLTFEIYPEGTYTRNGSLVELKYEGDLTKGKLVKIIAVFQNTGDVDTSAKFVGEVYKDGELFDTIESHTTHIPKYKEVSLEAYIIVNEDGKYTVKGHAIYEGRTTEDLQVDFNVGSASAQGLTNELFFLIFIVVFIGLFIVYISGKRKEKEIRTKNKLITKIVKLKKLKRKPISSKTHKKTIKPKKVPVKRKIKLKEKSKDVIKASEPRFKKKKSEKSRILKIEDMTAKEIEDYVKSL